MAGNMKFSHAVGYRGKASIDNTTLLCTGGNINISQDPIMSGGVWGAGYVNAAPIAYAFNYLSLEGSVNFEWVADGTVWNALKKFAFTDRTSQTNVHLLPDGINGFKGNGWCSSLSMEASEGAALTGSFNFKGDPSDKAGGIVSNNDVTTLGASDAQLKTGTGNGSSIAGATLIPYWVTSVYTNNKQIDDVINWSCSYNSDLQVLKCCNYQSTAPISADYILCGEMSGEGSITVFALRENGDCSFSPEAFHNRKQNLKFEIGFGTSQSNGTTTYNTKKYVTVPYALISSGSTSMTTGASYISCDFSFTAIGDGVNSIMTMSA